VIIASVCLSVCQQ